MIERRLQVIQELREAFKEAQSELHAAQDVGDIEAANYAAQRLGMAYDAFQMAVEAYEKDRLRGTRGVRAGGTGNGFKGR